MFRLFHLLFPFVFLRDSVTFIEKLQEDHLSRIPGRLPLYWRSTDQGSASTSKSEIKTVEFIANRGILDMMGWTQAPTVIEEDQRMCGSSTNLLDYTLTPSPAPRRNLVHGKGGR